ncbi:AhpC/TSA family protein [Cytobacillus spongiae]|uniref:peroxiredoxin-like family protein n=1 Tax=Cytobacillus spongiae TaxID=2901381 RepID=UPI001F4580BA|nr:peroxiredoxin-like family protein [Cytobacillus spongiae]UII57559.1 AhpC/TSA family protein [Cytobacillus spongiae]
MSLTTELTEIKNRFLAKAPEEVIESVTKATNELLEAGVGSGLKVGDKAPNFTLPNTRGESVQLFDELKKGKVVLSFYRGGWCPYCNLELRAYQSMIEEIHEGGATVLAISPQKIDESLMTEEKNELSFHVLSDEDYTVIKDYKLYFEFPDHLVQTYSEKFSLDLSKYNGSENPWSLPVPGTLIIDQDGTILKSYANVNYMERLDPQEVLAYLTK